MKLKKSDNKKEQPKALTLTILPPKIDKYNESNEATLKNIHTMAILNAKMFGRLGYQIKLLEEIKEQLIKLNKTVEKG